MLRRALGACAAQAPRLLRLQPVQQNAWAAVSVLHSHGPRARAFAAAPATPMAVPQSKMADSHLNGASTAYLEELEARFRENPASVDKSWSNFFNLIGELPE